MEKYNFPVKLTPVKTNGILIPNKFAVLRTDTKHPIGIVSNKYQLLKHETVVNGFRQALKKTKYEEKIQLRKDGSSLFATYKISENQLIISKGDIVSLQFVVKNSYNGKNSLQIILGAFRLVCENGMIIGKEFFSFSRKHIGQGELKTELLIESITQLSSQFKESLPIMQQMTKMKMGRNEDKAFKEDDVLPTYMLEAAQKEYMLWNDNSVWGFYNSLTKVITHQSKRDNPARQIKFGARAWSLALKQLK